MMCCKLNCSAASGQPFQSNYYELHVLTFTAADTVMGQVTLNRKSGIITIP